MGQQTAILLSAVTLMNDLQRNILTALNKSPVFEAAFGLPDRSVPSFDNIFKLSDAIRIELGFGSEYLQDEKQKQEVCGFYLPLALWLNDQAKMGKKNTKENF